MLDPSAQGLNQDISFKFNCLIEGESIIFRVVGRDCVAELKKVIHSEVAHTLQGVDAYKLELWKVNIDVSTRDRDYIGNIRLANLEDVKRLEPLETILHYWPRQPSDGYLHIIVEAPVTGVRRTRSPQTPEHSAKRLRLEENGTMRTPPNTVQLPTKVAPPHLKAGHIEREMLAALEPFTEYIYCLAKGKLDGYFNSLQEVVTDLKVQLPTRPKLLLHGLAENTDKKEFENMCTGTPSICRLWCWKNSPDKNVDVANRAFAMLICARVFVLKKFLEYLPPNTDVMVARRRWVLAQVLPPSCPFGNDIFTTIVKSLRPAGAQDMVDLASAMMGGVADIVGREQRKLIAVVDEAQIAAVYLNNYFRSFTTGTETRPVLQPFHRFLLENNIFQAVILAGTGLSMDMVKKATSSRVAKLGARTLVSVDLGRFTRDDAKHLDYIRKYLSRSDSISYQRLEERILYWFSGRYRFTASLIELLLYTQPNSPHRVLSAFVKSLTQFTITDAIDLEEEEQVLTVDTLRKIADHEALSAVDRLFDKTGQEHLIQCLFQAFMRWRIGSQPMLIPVEGNVHELIALGIGHLEKVEPSGKLDPNQHYPVYLCEPLVVLYLGSVFDKYPHTKKDVWIAEAFCTARNPQFSGILFEEAVLLVLSQGFGGKSCALSDVFHCNQPWGSRKVTLVSLKRTADGSMQCCPVSWTSGSSDRLGFKATSPKDVLEFVNNPNGKCFILPDNHMGPDVMCFLQDEETKELILVLLQAKVVSPYLSVAAWHSAIDTITPQYFYTSNTKNGRVDYAPIQYPGLSDDIMMALDPILGKAEYKPVVDKFREKLCSSKADNEQLAALPPRKTPKYLRIIATKNAHKNWKSKCKDDVGALRWDRVKACLGSAADAIMAGPSSVP